MYYFDNAATEPVKAEVLEAMLPYFTKDYGNPSGLYSIGEKSKKAIESAKKIIAKEINANPKQIFFTSGGTESNNWVKYNADVWLRSPFEHKSLFKDKNDIVLDTFQGDVILDYATLINSYQKKKKNIVSIQTANNETGIIQDIKSLCYVAHDHGYLFHTDATQVFGKIPINVLETNVDFMTFSGHKIGAPKGIGVLYIKNPSKIKPFITGGSQQQGLRAGTENVPYIIGLGKAVELINYNNKLKLWEQRTRIISAIQGSCKDVLVNESHHVSEETQLPNIISVSFKGISGESIVMLENINNVAIATGSACNNYSAEVSHVVKALEIPEDYRNGTIRISLGNNTSDKAIDTLLETLIHNVKILRELN